MRTIAIANQKGGVGKTTTTVNLAAGLALSGASVLLVDLDPQGNATMGSGIDKQGVENNIYDWLIDGVPLTAVIQDTPGSYAVVPANTDLTAAELALMNAERRDQRLKDRLQSEASSYDYVLIDCPPSLNVLTINALIAADGVLIPMQCEYYALEGLTALLETVDGVRQRGNASLAIEGILRTMYDPRNGLTRDVSRQLIEHFGDKVFRTVIPRNIRLAEAPSHGLPAMLYDRQSRGSVAYMALAGELKRKHSQTVVAADPSPAALPVTAAPATGERASSADAEVATAAIETPSAPRVSEE